MKKYLLALSLLFLGGCALARPTYSRGYDPKKEAEQARQEQLARVVYTPLAKGTGHTKPEDMEILLRVPEKHFKEIGLVSIDRKYSNETAADLFKLVKERVAAEGGDAVLLRDVGGTQVGTVTRGGATAIANSAFGNSYTMPIIQEAIHGVAIVYVE